MMVSRCGARLVQIGPSILNADLSNLTAACAGLLAGGADYMHLDVMDGHFVPNLTFGHPVVKCLRENLGAQVLFDAHMMVAEPERWIQPMSAASPAEGLASPNLLYTFHVEASENPARCVRLIREAGMRAGIAIKPGTPVAQLLDDASGSNDNNGRAQRLLDMVDCVLVMTVEPGFGGQRFMTDMLAKVEKLRELGPKNLDIGVDGGVNLDNIGKCFSAGANMIVAGTSLVCSPNPKSVITQFKQISATNFS